MKVSEAAQFEAETLDLLARPVFVGAMLVMGRHQPCNNTKVAKVLGTQHPYVSKIMKLLKSSGMIEEDGRAPNNGRTIYYKLTPKGRIFADCYWELVELWENG